MTKLRTKRRLGKPNKVKAGLIGAGITAAVMLLVTGIVLTLVNNGKEASEEEEPVVSLTETSQSNVTVTTSFHIDTEDAEKKQFGQSETVTGKGDESYGDITYSLSYPLSSDPRLNAALAQQVEAIASQFASEAKYSKRKNAEGRLTAELQGGYEAYVANGRYGGVILETAKYLADTAEPEHTLTALPVDFVESRILSVTDIFKDGGLEQLAQICRDAVASQVEEDINEEGLAPTAENYANIIFSSGSLRVYFNKYQVATGSHGMIEVRIPYTLLEDYLNIDMATSQVGQAIAESQPVAAPTATASVEVPEATATAALAQPSPTPLTQPAAPSGTGNASIGVQSAPGATEPQGQKLVALTFDDGPHGEYTEHILDVLEKYHAHATFFVVGNRIEGREKVLQRMDKMGCQIGNHTWSHADLVKLPQKGAIEEIEKTNQAVKAVTGKGTELLRPPYCSKKGLEEFVQYPMILWSVDTEDWKNKNPEMIFREATKIKKSGNILLFHDIYPTTVEAVERIVPELQKKGFQFVTVSEMFAAMNKKLEAGQIYALA